MKTVSFFEQGAFSSLDPVLWLSALGTLMDPSILVGMDLLKKVPRPSPSPVRPFSRLCKRLAQAVG